MANVSANYPPTGYVHDDSEGAPIVEAAPEFEPVPEEITDKVLSPEQLL